MGVAVRQAWVTSPEEAASTGLMTRLIVALIGPAQKQHVALLFIFNWPKEVMRPSLVSVSGCNHLPQAAMHI